MITTSSVEPHLWSTGFIEDEGSHDDVVGLRLSYTLHECFFTVHISGQVPNTNLSERIYRSDKTLLKDFVRRFNEACTFSDGDQNVEDIDKRLDPLWQEAEDLVKNSAFDSMVCLSRQHGNRSLPNGNGHATSRKLVDYLRPKCFNLQIVQRHGGFTSILREDLEEHLPFVAEPDVLAQQDLLNVQAQQVEILLQQKPHVLKVSINGKTFCCKLNNAGSPGTFVREFSVLQRVQGAGPKDLCIPRLRGTVQIENGVVGILTDWIDTDYPDLMALLGEKKDISRCRRHRWAEQISSTLKQIHALNLIWGDAKTANVLIDSNDVPWLVDFGGGFTCGWVDERAYDTRAGDMQGLQNILLDIYGKR